MVLDLRGNEMTDTEKKHIEELLPKCNIGF
jgi:hypothetical protein